MAQSRDLDPSPSPFFPNIFFTNQFCTKPVSNPTDTDLSNRVALVTGGNQGLGLEASTQLLSLHLSHLIIASRSPSRGEAAASSLRSKFPKAKIDVLQLDMTSYSSIQSFVARLEDRFPQLDYAILNAGVRKMKYDIVEETGHEETFQVNYLSTALLCVLLIPLLKRKARDNGPGKISIVSSGLALTAKFRNVRAEPLIPSFDRAEDFETEEAYNVSKLLGMMFLYELERRVSAEDVIVNLVDPGFVKGTNLTKGLPFVKSVLFAGLKRVAARSLEVGASTYVDALIVKGKESHGCYIMSWEICPFASILYTPEGKEAIARLWKETIAELSFANVQEVLGGLS